MTITLKQRRIQISAALCVAAVIILAFCFGHTAAPGPTQLADGLAAYKRADWPEARKFLQPLADTGNAAAQFQLGKMYYWGDGGKWEEKTAAALFLKAAPQGNAQAQWYLASMYAAGFGVKQDYAEALFWRSLAARHGAFTGPGQEGEDPAAHLTPEQIAAVKKRVLEWKPEGSGSPG